MNRVHFSDDYRRGVYDSPDEALEQFGEMWGLRAIYIAREDVQAILAGKCFAFEDGEYAHYLVMGEPEEGE